MKQLTLIRHAKSSWDDPDLHDLERPLNQRGQRNAPDIAERLQERGISPDLVLLSPAVRVRETAGFLLPALHVPDQYVLTNESIYLASCSTLLRLVRSQPDDANHLMLIGHNPGLTDLWNLLCPELVDNIPTCGVFSLGVKSLERWQKMQPNSGHVMFVDYPKKRKTT